MADSAVCFVVSAPSGAGKSTLADRVLRRVDRLTRTVSCSTRAPRDTERDGIDYFFVTGEEFERRRRADEFLEWAEVHGNLYGTLHSEIDRIRAMGHDAILVIDVQGAASVRARVPEAVTVFVLPPSRAVLEARLRGRDGESPERRAAIERRLGVAAHEIEQYVGYDYVVINDEFEQAVEELAGVIRAERCRRDRREAAGRAILESFRRPAADGASSPETPVGTSGD